MQLINEMKPTRRTLFIRQCKIYQLFRFLSLTLKVLKVALFPPHDSRH
ncbi:hypothetical protein M670_03252 [Schinkia azotoformans MEV2011]|uniref:Uncharacterized protein n=1 Tax=Schinkia azotoformans MEV2011 TaxID=1348973 RepID=A0A072NW16_SCHAZ|nr:hypothetical protein M670_03252 [Schinkia azotoformans MEV2011]